MMFSTNMKISSFFKIQHLAVAQQGSGHTEKLSFPHREILSVLRHLRVQWMRQLADLRPVTDSGEEKCFSKTQALKPILSLTISLMCVFSRASQIWESEYWSHGSKLDLWEHKKTNWIKHDDTITFMETADATLLRFSWQRSTLTLARGCWLSKRHCNPFVFSLSTLSSEFVNFPLFHGKLPFPDLKYCKYYPT